MDDLSVGAGVATIIALLCGVAFFSATEIAFLAADRVRVREEAEAGSVTARLLLTFFSRPNQVLSTILICITALLYFSEHIATIIATELWATLGPVVAFFAIGLVAMVFAEVTPIILASQAPDRLLRLAAWPLKGTVVLLALVVVPVTRISNFLVRLVGLRAGEEPIVTEEEIKTTITVAQEQGVMAETRHRMLHGVLEFTDRQVSEVMVPRTDMVCVEANEPIQKALDLIVDERHSRLPVYEGDVDKIVGILYAKDLIPALQHGDRTTPVARFAREAQFVPETKKVRDLMRDFQAEERVMAMVVDEFGGIAGLVTMEDLLEEIVGEIYDETDEVNAEVEVISENEILCDGVVPIHTMNKLLHTDIQEAGYETVGGLVQDIAGYLPEAGEVCRRDNLTLTVEQVEGKRISKVRVVKEPVAEDSDTPPQ